MEPVSLPEILAGKRRTWDRETENSYHGGTALSSHSWRFSPDVSEAFPPRKTDRAPRLPAVPGPFQPCRSKRYFFFSSIGFGAVAGAAGAMLSVGAFMALSAGAIGFSAGGGGGGASFFAQPENPITEANSTATNNNPTFRILPAPFPADLSVPG
jgi:hypothetical protein